MALVDTVWYCNAGDQSTTGYYAIAKWATGATIAAGALRRQNTAPAVGSERVFVCIVAGTTHATTEPTWVLTRGAKTTDNTVTWQECTGEAALNGDLTNTATWAQVKAATPAVLGQIIKRSNSASYQICTTAGAMSASEPAFSDTAGVTTTDTTAVWTSLGVVGNFTGGQAPFARLASACTATWFIAGNTVYVGDNHAETQATAITVAPNTTGVLAKLLCHSHSGSYPPTATTTGATVTTTGANAITLAGAGAGGWIYVYGVAFAAGSGASSGSSFINIGAQAGGITLDNCSLQLLNTVAGGTTISLGTSASVATPVVLNNTTMKFGSTGSVVSPVGGLVTWQNTATPLVSGSSVPASLFFLNSSNTISTLVVEGADLSAVTGLVAFNAAMPGTFTFKDCKINASATVATPSGVGSVVQLVRCDSGAAAYKSARYAYEGTETTETSITRVGGASDPTGQAQSRKIVTTANSQWLRPFKAEPYAIWNPTTGSNVTVTVYGTINAGSLPNNDDIWLEIEYLGSASFPIGTMVTTTKATLLSSNAAVASDGSTWNGGGSGAGWSPFKLTTTLSSPQPGLAGYIHARVRAAKASTTYYIDPQVVLS